MLRCNTTPSCTPMSSPNLVINLACDLHTLGNLDTPNYYFNKATYTQLGFTQNILKDKRIFRTELGNYIEDK